MEQESGKETPVKKKTVARKRNMELESATDGSASVEEIPVTDFQSYAKEVVSRQFANIMKAMAEKSAKGSLAHTKYLFEIAGVKEEIQRQGQSNGEPSLAEILLAEVRRQSEPEASSLVGPAE